jgi:outer membrane murein-binding lipoprotein Lpp
VSLWKVIVKKLFLNSTQLTGDEIKMDLIKLLNDLVASIEALKAQLADAQAAADALAKTKYDEGFAAGVASVDKGFTQADLDAAVASAVAPLSEKIAALQSQIDGIPGQIQAAKDEIKAKALELLKTEEADLEAKLGSL